MGNEEPERPDWTLGPADAAKLSLCPFSAVEGEAIIRQGDVGSTFFLITAGTVGIRRQVGGSIHELGTLGPGSIVGELAVLRRAPRNATVVALEPVVGFTGDLGAMERLVGHDAAFPERLATVAASRLAEAAEMLRAGRIPDDPQRLRPGLSRGGCQLKALAQLVGPLAQLCGQPTGAFALR